MRAVLVAASVLVWLQMAEAITYKGKLKNHKELTTHPSPVASHVTKVQLRLKRRSWTCAGGLTATIKFGTIELEAKSAGGMWSHTFYSPLPLSAGAAVVLLNTDKVCDFDYIFILDITADSLVPTPIPTPIPTPRPASSAGLCTSTTNSDFVGLMACGDSTCRTIVRYPVGQQIELCDPCVKGPLGVYATITRSGSLYTLATGGLTMSSTCGQCTSIGKIQFDVPCGSGGGPAPTATPMTPVPTPIPTPMPTHVPTPRPASSAGLCTSTTNSDFVEVAACGAAACRTTVRYPLGQRTQLCDPCVSGPLGVYATIARSGSSYTVVIDGHRSFIRCGQCTSSRGLNFDVPCGSGSAPTARDLCTSTSNSDFVEVGACGAAACRTTVRYPLGQRTQLCDPCVSGPLGVYATIARSGSSYTVDIDGDTSSVPCGQCTSSRGLNFDVPCHAEGTNMLLIVLPIAGGVVALVAIIGLGVWWCRRSTPAGEVKAVQEQQVSTETGGEGPYTAMAVVN